MILDCERIENGRYIFDKIYISTKKFNFFLKKCKKSLKKPKKILKKEKKTEYEC